MNISIVIPLYNEKDAIERSLDSVKRQTVQPREIIVVNDGSTDGSEDVVSLMNIPGLRIISQENAGVSAARNKGIFEAKSEWVAFLDADDEWLPNYLETILHLMEKYPDKLIYATSYYLGDYNGAKRKVKLNRMPFNEEIGEITNYFEVASFSAPPIWTSAVCVNRCALLDIGGFPDGVIAGEDLLTWARLAVRTPPAYCKTPLAVFWRDKAHTYLEKPGRIPQDDDPVGKALIELSRDPIVNTDHINLYISHWFKMRASIYLRLNMRLKAVRETMKGLLLNPMNNRLWLYFGLAFLPKQMIAMVFRRFSK